MDVLPHLSRLYADYLAWPEVEAVPVRRWYGAQPGTGDWMGREVAVQSPAALAEALLTAEGAGWYGAAALANIERLRGGARAVVTGQQVGLFGGPLLTLLKAATAIARAKEAEHAIGVPHVPVFWLASEDHDLPEVNQVTLAGKHALATLRLQGFAGGGPVGAMALPENVQGVLEQATELLGYAPVCELLQETYGKRGATLASAFGSWMSRLFAGHGLVVVDAAGREFHRLGAPVLRYAVEHAEELETALLARTAALEAAGYHAQVLVKPGTSLLFLLEGGERLALRRTAAGDWKAGARSLTTAELLAILDSEPERLSPNALLRPVFQDTLFPVAAYVGGPAEVAYFAQTEVLYRAMLGRVTPVLPRFSATLVTPAIAAVMAKHELQLSDIFAAGTAEALAQRLGARAMPIEGKRRIAAVGKALDEEVQALTGFLAGMDASLGRSAEVAGSKMLYQMNRLRRMAASYQVQKESSLRKHADAMMLQLFPDGHPQERVLAGLQFLAGSGTELVDRLVVEAESMCLGHAVLPL